VRLKPSLLNLTKAKLSDLRSLYDLKNISHLNKADLVDRMVKLLPARFPMMLERIGQAAYDILRTMVAGKSSDGPLELDLDDDALDTLARYGLVFLIEDDGGEAVFHIPDELVTVFRAADGERLRETVRRNTEWVALTQGMLHYYGALELERIRQWLEELVGKPVPFMELFQVLQFACAYHGQMAYERGRFCDINAPDPDEVLLEHRRRPDTAFRRFSRKQLMAASVPDFLDRTPDMREFLDFIGSQYPLKKEALQQMALNLQDKMRSGASVPDLIKGLQQWIVIPSETFLNNLLQRLTALYNATRQWALKGHTPNELFEEERRYMRPLPDPIRGKPGGAPVMSMSSGGASPFDGAIPFAGGTQQAGIAGTVLPFPGMPARPGAVGTGTDAMGAGTVSPVTGKSSSVPDVKVGRNDPCPCGSGKKYKKCCMGKSDGSVPE
jgi:hypothetical protein